MRYSAPNRSGKTQAAGRKRDVLISYLFLLLLLLCFPPRSAGTPPDSCLMVVSEHTRTTSTHMEASSYWQEGRTLSNEFREQDVEGEINVEFSVHVGIFISCLETTKKNSQKLTSRVSVRADQSDFSLRSYFKQLKTIRSEFFKLDLQKQSALQG